MPLTGAEFARLMAPLGPFEPAPHLAVAVSGGADSLALALLAAAWARDRGGIVTGLVVDHGLRGGSAAEASLACTRLARHGVTPRLLPLTGLERGPALAARARMARAEALRRACAATGILHLLLGHHAADQVETVAIRGLSGSGSVGLAGMAALVETAGLRLLRPLLPIPPGRLRATLRVAGEGWSEDPSNRDLAALRNRVRAAAADPDGTGAAIAAGWDAAAALGIARAAADGEIAAILAERAEIHPEGYARLSPGPIAAAALAALLRMLAGRAYPLPLRQVARVAANPGPATLGGARLVMRGGSLLVGREAAAMGAAVAARPGVVWDGRFRLGRGEVPEGAMLGAVGAAAAGLRRRSSLPTAVLQTLPALRLDGRIIGVPHLGIWAPGVAAELHPEPPVAAAPAAFVGAGDRASFAA